MKLLECTLRDGSYAIDFQFTAKFTGDFCRILESAKFELIEIGHGVGIGADKKFKPAAATDIEYGRAASKVLKRAKWGMFAQPSISSLDEIEDLTNIGMGFIRIGIDLDDLEIGLDLAKKCSDLGLKVYINLMKSYKNNFDQMLPKLETVKKCDWLEGFYLVDSAGGMMMNEVEKFSKNLSSFFSNEIKLGFHGHDNLGLAIPNSLIAVDNGFELIDCTMQGMGRSAGNTNAERLVTILEKEQIKIDIDPVEVMKLSEEYIRPKLPKAGHAGLDTMAGFTLFHTAYMDELIKISKTYKVDPYKLMEKIGSNSIFACNLDGIIQNLIEDGELLNTNLPIDLYVGNEQ